jgi:raffinose/stachyose/melibiose transport system permease protein
VIALVVVAVVWRRIYEPTGWLGDFTLALPAIGLVGTWVAFGLALVLLLAGVQRIPRSLYDAARVDGAGPVREFFAVTLPNVRGELAVALTLTTITALRNFDLVYVTTGGGPGNATTVPALEVYRRAFGGGEVGAAAAVGVCLAAVIFVLALAINRAART